VSNLKLVPDDPTPLEKLLLDASRAEMPSDDHKARMRAVLGIGLPVSGPLAAPPPAASQTAASLAPPPGGVLRSATALKVAVGVGALALIGALWFTRQPRSEPLPAPPRLIAPAEPAPAPVALPAAPAAAAEIAPLPPVEPTALAPRVRSAPPAASASDDLSEQIRLIEAARAGVAAHSPRAALIALDSYAAKFPRGSFGQEAMVLRIRAVDQAGDTARATALAKAFVARFPTSPHVARLKPIAERGASR
jgi:hypothetical protein